MGTEITERLRALSNEYRHNESPKILTIIPLGYRAHCIEAGVSQPGRVILRHFEAGGRPMSNSEFCNAHARARIEWGRALGLRVYDDREAS